MAAAPVSLCFICICIFSEDAISVGPPANPNFVHDTGVPRYTTDPRSSGGPMYLRPSLRHTILIVLAIAAAAAQSNTFAQAPTSAAQPGELTIDRIYGQPSLSGRLTRGIAWSPDGKRLTFLDSKGTAPNAKTELWSLDAATGERSLLISADKLESIFPAPPAKQSQATGAGRHAPSQYQWAPTTPLCSSKDLTLSPGST